MPQINSELYNKVENIVADIRNDLTPFWTLSAMMERQTPTNELDKVLHKAAKNAEHQKLKITDSLDEILKLVKKQETK